MEPPKKQPDDPCSNEHTDFKENKGHSRFWIFGIVAAILIGLFLWGGIPRFIKSEQMSKEAAEKPEIQVRVAQVQPETKPKELILPSYAQAYHATPLWARTDGYLINYEVDIGDHVKQGQLLAEIDTPEVDQQLDQASADLKSAIARREIAKISADRWQALFKKNPEAISTQEVDERTTTLESAKADVESFQKNVDRLHYLQQYKKIYAPFDGTITKRNIDIGSLITAGSTGANPQELFELAQTNIIRFFVDVPQYFFRNIHDGLEAEVYISEYQGKAFKGHVVRYAKALDPTARTLLTEVDVENPDGEIVPGLYATVKFAMKPPANSFIVPTDAVIIRSGSPKVALVDDQDIVHIKNVQIGQDFGKTMEIVAGLQDKDVVIINPTDRIVEGLKVKINK